MVQEFTSANTSINSSKVPAVFKKIWWGTNPINLDIGGGKFDTATNYLDGLGVKNLIYDPYNRSEAHNAQILAFLAEHGKVDSATLSNVLNVIKEPEVRRELLVFAQKHARKVFITVYEGNRSGIGKASKKGCWQENRKLTDYVQEVKNVFKFALVQRGMIIAFDE